MVSVEKGIFILTWNILKTSLSYNVKNRIKGARGYCSILGERRCWLGLGRWREMAVQQIRPGEWPRRYIDLSYSGGKVNKAG